MIGNILTGALLVGVGILLFNLMIFVHELGHFFAARWRGLYVDRFQVWFGKPIWKKKINGVEWGVGWIPAGGFVSLPQLAPMDAIEGEVDPGSVKEFLEKNGKAGNGSKLPPIKPLDKIIVAFAGPFFSFLLAVVFALLVWVLGKPVDAIQTTTIGYVLPDSPAAEAGLLPGDKILAIDGQAVSKWAGNMEGVAELIMLSENPKISFTIEREGVSEPMVIESGYVIPEKSWWERRAMRQAGVDFTTQGVVMELYPNSPAEKAGIKKGDVFTAVNGVKLWSANTLFEETQKGEPLSFTITREGEPSPITIEVTPVLPDNAEALKIEKPAFGFLIGRQIGDGLAAVDREHPTPWAQIVNSFNWMKVTLAKISASGSSVSVEHLTGPVGILNMFYRLLSAEDGIFLVLWFAVVLNINLAVLNLLPFPVVDGGHIVLGFAEMIRGKEVSGKPLELVQSGFVIVLLLFFAFVSFKDVGDLVGSGSKSTEKEQGVPIFKK